MKIFFILLIIHYLIDLFLKNAKMKNLTEVLFLYIPGRLSPIEPMTLFIFSAAIS